MAEFDLIPEEFRRARALKLRLTAAASVSLMTLTALLVGLWVFSGAVTHLEEEVKSLEHARALSEREQAEVTRLQQRIDKLNAQALTFTTLRSGTPIPALVQNIERALIDDGVYFERWEFDRQGIRVGDDREIRVPGVMGTLSPGQNWFNVTQLSIHGLAGDHQALSDFVGRLFEEPPIKDVRILRASQRDERIAFTIALLIETTGNAS